MANGKQAKRLTTERAPLLLVCLLGWIIAIAVGTYVIWNYGSKPGAISHKIHAWPSSSALSVAKEKPTLLMFLHPKCPCSKTSINELEILLGEHGDEFDTTLVFVVPTGEKEDWTDTSSRRRVESLHGVKVHDDLAGSEGYRFGVGTSGETFLFSPEGVLLFHGGITAARGHAGNSEGRRFLSKWTHEHKGKAELRTTPVFGCALDGLCTSPHSDPIL